MQKENRHSVSLWVVVFALTAGLQVFRGSLGDSIIFILGTALIVTVGFAPKEWDIPTKSLISDRQLSITMVLLGIGLVLLPRHSQQTELIMLCVAPLAVLLAWGNHRGPKKKASDRISKARLLWIIWATVTCIWEFAANILGQLHNSHTMFPTISILIDPLLDTVFGQAGFVAVWVLVGMSLLRLGRRP
jgi:hypothetical protein